MSASAVSKNPLNGWVIPHYKDSIAFKVAKVVLTVFVSLMPVAAYLYKGSYIGIVSTVAVLLVDLYIWSNRDKAVTEEFVRLAGAADAYVDAEEAPTLHEEFLRIARLPSAYEDEVVVRSKKARRPFQKYYLIGGERVDTGPSAQVINMQDIISRNPAANFLVKALLKNS